jgi:hypothetical protein
MEPHRATTSGGARARAKKRCGSDSSYFDLMFNIKKRFKMAPIVLRPHMFTRLPAPTSEPHQHIHLDF